MKRFNSYIYTALILLIVWPDVAFATDKKKNTTEYWADFFKSQDLSGYPKSEREIYFVKETSNGKLNIIKFASDLSEEERTEGTSLTFKQGDKLWIVYGIAHKGNAAIPGALYAVATRKRAEPTSTDIVRLHSNMHPTTKKQHVDRDNFIKHHKNGNGRKIDDTLNNHFHFEWKKNLNKTYYESLKSWLWPDTDRSDEIDYRGYYDLQEPKNKFHGVQRVYLLRFQGIREGTGSWIVFNVGLDGIFKEIGVGIKEIWSKPYEDNSNTIEGNNYYFKFVNE